MQIHLVSGTVGGFLKAESLGQWQRIDADRDGRERAGRAPQASGGPIQLRRQLQQFVEDGPDSVAFSRQACLDKTADILLSPSSRLNDLFGLTDQPGHEPSQLCDLLAIERFRGTRIFENGPQLRLHLVQLDLFVELRIKTIKDLTLGSLQEFLVTIQHEIEGRLLGFDRCARSPGEVDGWRWKGILHSSEI